MDDTFTRFFHDLFARLDGPLHFRFFLQPGMAIFFAVRDGLKDARKGKPPFLRSLVTEPEHRRDLLRDGWHSISKLFILAVLLDVAYQVIALHRFYPFETLLVSVLLALTPYVLVRGSVDRLKRRLSAPPSPHR
jgi:hypothetical protein